jgi:hypothetical protein
MTSCVFDRPFAAIHASHLSAVSGGMRPNDSESGAPSGVPPIHLPATSFNAPSSKPKCPPWRAWQGQHNIGILSNGTPTMVPTLHCPMYRPSSKGK